MKTETNIDGRILTLKGVSQKGRNRVIELGKEWVVLRTAPLVLFDTRPGEWLFIRPIGGEEKHDRWILSRHDKNFEVLSGL